MNCFSIEETAALTINLKSRTVIKVIWKISFLHNILQVSETISGKTTSECFEYKHVMKVK